MANSLKHLVPALNHLAEFIRVPDIDMSDFEDLVAVTTTNGTGARWSQPMPDDIVGHVLEVAQRMPAVPIMRQIRVHPRMSRFFVDWFTLQEWPEAERGWMCFGEVIIATADHLAPNKAELVDQHGSVIRTVTWFPDDLLGTYIPRV